MVVPIISPFTLPVWALKKLERMAVDYCRYNLVLALIAAAGQMWLSLVTEIKKSSGT